METFSELLALSARNSPVTIEIPHTKPVTRSFDVFFDLRLNKRMSKQSRRWWFEMPSCSLWRHYSVSCGDMRQTWVWFKGLMRYFCNGGNVMETLTLGGLVFHPYIGGQHQFTIVPGLCCIRIAPASAPQFMYDSPNCPTGMLPLHVLWNLTDRQVWNTPTVYFVCCCGLLCYVLFFPVMVLSGFAWFIYR